MMYLDWFCSLFILLSIDYVVGFQFSRLRPSKVFDPRCPSPSTATHHQFAPCQSTPSSIPPALLSDLNTTYMEFEDSNEIIIEFDSNSVDRKWFIPKALENASGEQTWQFWRQKKLSEQSLNEAIEMSREDLQPYFQQYKQYLTVEKASILQLNHDFFLAWQNGYDHIFREIWMNSSQTMSLIAGDNNVITGYENITYYWGKYAAQRKASPFIKQVYLHFYGDVAIVTSAIDLLSSPSPSPSPSSSPSSSSSSRKKATISSKFAHSTNIFTYCPAHDKYYLLAHLSSLSPVGEGKGWEVLKKTYQEPRTGNNNRRGFMRGVGLEELGDILRATMGGGGRGRGESDEEGEYSDSEEESDEESDEETDEDSEEDEDSDEDSEEEEERARSSRRRRSEESSDEEEEEEGGEEEVLRRRVSKIQEALTKTLNKIGGKELTGRVIIVGRDPSSSTSSLLGGMKTLSLSPFMKGQRDEGLGGAGGLGEEKHSRERISSLAISALDYLYHTNRLSKEEKTLLSTDIIRHLSASTETWSKAEVAFTLLIGGFRPGEGGNRLGGAGGMERLPEDLSLVAEEDLEDFESMCHKIALELGATTNNSNNSNSNNNSNNNSSENNNKM